MSARDLHAQPPDDAVARLRVPPHSAEAEHSVIGSVLLDNGCWDAVSDLVKEADFYRFEHRLIWSALADLIARGKPADTITTLEALEAAGKATDVGGLAYLNALADSIPSARNARRYAEIVAERAALRRLIAAADEIATAAFNTQGRGVAEIIDEAERRVLGIAQADRQRVDGTASIDRVMTAMMDRVSQLHDKGSGDITGVPTGFVDLDRKLSGLQPSDLVVLAARPSMGKTALALNMAEHAAVRESLPVLVFSMEMSAAQLGMRLAGSNGRIDQQRLRTGRLEPDEWGRLSDAVDRVGRARMLIDETPALTVDTLRSRARRHARALGGTIGLVVVDYLQLMRGSAKGDENRATELGEITRGLKALAKELQCPVLVLSQLNRSVESRTDKRPMMSDLRESGAIEQDADVILFIYRDDYYNEHSDEPGVAEILVAKQRSGPTGTVRLAWHGAQTRFNSLAADYKVPARRSRAKPEQGASM